MVLNVIKLKKRAFFEVLWKTIQYFSRKKIGHSMYCLLYNPTYVHFGFEELEAARIKRLLKKLKSKVTSSKGKSYKETVIIT